MRISMSCLLEHRTSFGDIACRKKYKGNANIVYKWRKQTRETNILMIWAFPEHNVLRIIFSMLRLKKLRGNALHAINTKTVYLEINNCATEPFQNLKSYRHTIHQVKKKMSTLCSLSTCFVKSDSVAVPEQPSISCSAEHSGRDTWTKRSLAINMCSWKIFPKIWSGRDCNRSLLLPAKALVKVKQYNAIWKKILSKSRRMQTKSLNYTKACFFDCLSNLGYWGK